MKTLGISGKITFELLDLYVEVHDGFDLDDVEALKDVAVQYMGSEHLNWNANTGLDICIEDVFDCEELL